MIYTGPGVRITAENRDEWLASRANTIGSSDAASVVGVGWDAPIDVWQRKLGLAPPVVENVPMRVGKALEPLLAEEYRRRTDAEFDEQLFFVHPGYPWMVATLDGMRPDGRIVEFKTTSGFSKDWGDEDSDHVPEAYLVQVHHQMAVTGATEADLFVLVGNSHFKGPYTIHRDDSLVEAITTREAAFRLCLLNRTPPDWGKQDARMLAILNPGCAGEIELSDETAYLVGLYQTYQGSSKELETRRKELSTQILSALGEAQFGRLPDGRWIKRFRQEMPARTQVVAGHIRHYFTVLKGEG